MSVPKSWGSHSDKLSLMRNGSQPVALNQAWRTVPDSIPSASIPWRWFLWAVTPWRAFLQCLPPAVRCVWSEDLLVPLSSFLILLSLSLSLSASGEALGSLPHLHTHACLLSCVCMISPSDGHYQTSPSRNTIVYLASTHDNHKCHKEAVGVIQTSWIHLFKPGAK